MRYAHWFSSSFLCLSLFAAPSLEAAHCGGETGGAGGSGGLGKGKQHARQQITLSPKRGEGSYSASMHTGEVKMAPKMGCQWLPCTPSIFKQYLADPHQVGMGVAYRNNDKILNTDLDFVSLGEVIPLYRQEGLFGGDWQFEAAIAGNLWGVFDLNAYSKDLINTNWLGGFPFTLRCEKLGFRARIYHISTHLGDEYMQRTPPPERVNPSYEVVDLAVDYYPVSFARLYGQVGVVLHHDKSYRMEPFHAALGAEIKGSCFKLGSFNAIPFAAAHLRMEEVHKMRLDTSATVGIFWSHGHEKKRPSFATQIEVYEGYSYEGQFGHERTNYVALALRYHL